MLDALPGHIGDVQQAVNTTEVNEGTVVGEVLDHTLNFQTFLQGAEQLLTLSTVFSFQNAATGDHHVVALLIQLDDFELKLFAFQVRGIANRTDVNQRTGQERTDRRDVNGEAAFNLTADDAFNDVFRFEGFFQFLPGFHTLGFFTGQTSLTETVFNRVQGYLNFITNADGQITILIQELRPWNDPFRLQASVDGYPVIVDINHGTGDNGAWLHFDVFQALFKQFCKAFAHDFSCNSVRHCIVYALGRLTSSTRS